MSGTITVRLADDQFAILIEEIRALDWAYVPVRTPAPPRPERIAKGPAYVLPAWATGMSY